MALPVLSSSLQFNFVFEEMTVPSTGVCLLLGTRLGRAHAQWLVLLTLSR